jgi:hypothetical protein
MNREAEKKKEIELRGMEKRLSRRRERRSKDRERVNRK